MKYIITLFILITSFNLNSQSIIIAEDVVMLEDTFPKKEKASYDTQLFIVDPFDGGLHRSISNEWFIQIAGSRIKNLESEVEELKSQIKELSDLLLTLIKK